jgi:high-affinity iron transporter
MFGTGLIVFRETLEAALFVGIIAASTKGLCNRTRWLALGVGVGALGSLLMAACMDRISALADGLGQDVLTSIILSVALLMLAWHCTWVSAHAKEMADDARQIGKSTVQGSRTLWALAIAVALAVLREGAETVLFVTGLMTGATETTNSKVLSVIAGLALGAATGWLIYAGLARFKTHRLFSITNTLILLLAGSLASQLAKTLNQANWVTILTDQAWDIAAFLPNDSAVGMVLHGLVGYDASPSQLQLLFFLCATGLIWFSARQMKARVEQALRTAPTLN